MGLYTSLPGLGLHCIITTYSFTTAAIVIFIKEMKPSGSEDVLHNFQNTHSCTSVSKR